MSHLAAELFRRTWSAEPECSASAPGRANLIGEHTDYNGGPVLPLAIEQRAWVAVGHSNGTSSEVISALDGRMRALGSGGRMPRGWAAYVVGVERALRERGVALPSELRVAVASSVPAGAGLSSSAALCVALVRAFSRLADVRLSRAGMVDVAHRAEHDHVGVQCGRMDQTVSVFGRRDHALLIESPTGPMRQLPFARAVLLLDSGKPHRLASGALNDRHAECEAALLALRERRPQLAALADLPSDDLARLTAALPEVLARRVRHVVTETRRVREAAAALAQNRFRQLGELLHEGHASLRDDFAASCVEADAMVEWAMNAGAWGARLTGAGWGGVVVVLAPEAALRDVERIVAGRFRDRFGTMPATWLTRASSGVRLER